MDTSHFKTVLEAEQKQLKEDLAKQFEDRKLILRMGDKTPGKFWPTVKQEINDFWSRQKVLLNSFILTPVFRKISFPIGTLMRLTFRMSPEMPLLPPSLLVDY